MSFKHRLSFKLRYPLILFLCRLRSIATHRDHFVRRLSVCHTPIAMFRRRHMHSSECCHYFKYIYFRCYLGYCVRGSCRTSPLSCTCPFMYLYIICVLQMCVTWVTVSEDRVEHRHCPVLVPLCIYIYVCIFRCV